jgi:Glycosyltransferase
MKVLFYSYPWAFQKRGGGETQLLKTKESLERLGVSVKLFDQWNDRLSDYDILHIFGSVKDSLGLIDVAKKSGLKVCVSSIFWTDIRRFMGELGVKNQILSLAHHVAKKTLPYFPSGRRSVFNMADLILPNSESEAAQIKKYFAIRRDKFCIVPNGVEERFKNAIPEEFVQKYCIKDFILYVGRIEPRKNQLNFIRAMKGFKEYPIVFIGDQTLEHKEYYDACLREKSDNMSFLGHIEHESSLFTSMYSASKVFCLTSWFETPGLAALEAGLAGKNIVITPYGSTKDYFDSFASYALPGDLKDIRKKVELALNKSFDAGLQKKILKEYMWNNTAKETLKAYDKVMVKKGDEL